LLVCTQRIGDVLLATPLAHSLKKAWPDVAVDFLVLPGTQGILEGNPDVDRVLVFPQLVNLREKVSQFARIWRRYDLAIAATPSDRARIFAAAASVKSRGFLTEEKHQWAQRRLLDLAIPFDNLHTHTISMGLQLLASLGIPSIAEVQTPRCSAGRWAERKDELGLGDESYAVIHPNPKFRYKMWRQENWSALIDWLHAQSLPVFLTGSNAPEEAAYVNAIAASRPDACRSLAGQLSLAETAELLRDARLYVGPDTAVTHIAAATGTPTIALFGPSNPVKWGPWPSKWKNQESPWANRGSRRQGNVWLIQGDGDCVPCLLEGCDRHLESESRCLVEISVERVATAASALLADT
jgi:heptosyltransferase-3